MIDWICAAVLQATTAQPQSGSEQSTSVTTASPSSSEPAPAVLEEIVVNGVRADIRVEIDKRIYRVTDTPQAQTSSTLEILAQIPSVTVTGAGRVQLLGNPGVTILIDGKPPVSADAALKVLPASQIDRFEVMTNPSAQYSAQGTAGIINIITVKRRLPGWSGTATVSGTTLGAGQLAVAPSLSRERWDFEASLSLARQRGETSARTKRVLGDAGGFSTLDLLQDDSLDNTEDRARVSSRFLYRISPSDTLSVSGEALDRRNTRWTTTEVSGSENYVERADAPDRSTGGSVSFDFERKGVVEGESLKASASVETLDWKLRSLFEIEGAAGSSPDSRYRTQTAIRNDALNLTVDYVRPFGGSAQLASGMSWSEKDESTFQMLRVLEGEGPGPETASDLDATRNLAAAYGTVQFPLANWTVKPGLRIEHNEFVVRASGASTRTEDIYAFPSLHLRRKIGDDLAINLSYSRRVNRPDAQRLTPFITYSSSTSAQSGNPDLQPELTNAFEARFEYAKNGFSAEATIYERRTSDSWSQATQRLSDLVNLTSYINTGRRSERGGELSVRGTLGGRWKYMSSLNLFSTEQAIRDDTAQSDFSYTVTSQLEYTMRQPESRPPSQVQLTMRHFGPRVFYDNRSSSFTQIDLIWRRPFSDNLSIVTTVSDLFNSAETRSRLTTPDIRERSVSRGAGTVVRAALVYRFK